MAFAEFLHTKGLLSEADLDELNGEYATRKAWFGTLAYLLGFMEVEDTDKVLQKQAVDKHMFGQTAVEMGLMTAEQVDMVLFFQSTPVSFGDVVLASQKLDRETIAEYLTQFGNLEPAS